MGMDLAPRQASFLCGNCCSSHLWRIRSSLPPSSMATRSQACGLTTYTTKSSRLSFAETFVLHSKHSKKGPFYVSAAAERDLELAEEDLQIVTTPLEAFYNRQSSYFESPELGKTRRIIEAGSLDPENPSPSILVMLGSQAFVNQLCYQYPGGNVEVYHFSLNVLADIKEQYDEARCFYINTTDFSEVSGSFDAIFLNYFPLFSKSLPRLLKEATRFCKPGGMVVLSLAQDRRHFVALKAQSGGLLQSHLPDEDTLANMVSALPLELVSFEDSSSLYLAVLKCHGAHNKGKRKNAKQNASSKEDNEYPLYLKSEVIHGFGRGSKKLGFPTANLSVESLSPMAASLSRGVFYGCAQVVGAGVDHNVYRMVMNIGSRPTFDDEGASLSLEVHILHDFESDFYGKELRIAVLGFIREEMQFSSLDDLITRIKKDIELMQGFLSDADLELQKKVPFFSINSA